MRMPEDYDEPQALCFPIPMPSGTREASDRPGIPVQITVGRLSPTTVGTIANTDGSMLPRLAALLREVADVMEATRG
jgi:hypothetical protein